MQMNVLATRQRVQFRLCALSYTWLLQLRNETQCNAPHCTAGGTCGITDK